MDSFVMYEYHIQQFVQPTKHLLYPQMKYVLKYDHIHVMHKEYLQQISWQIRMIDMHQHKYQTIKQSRHISSTIQKQLFTNYLIFSN